MRAGNDEGALLQVLGTVAAALTGPRPLPARLEAAGNALVPSIADRWELFTAGAASGAAVDGDDADAVVLNVSLEADGAHGTLRLQRSSARGQWTELERQLVRAVAEVMTAAIDAQLGVPQELDAPHLQDDFLATLSHELRTPLNIMTGWIDLLANGVLRPDQQERAIRILQRNAKMQARLLEDLIEASRILSGRLTLELDQVELSELLTNAAEAFRPQAEEAKLTLGLRLDSSIAIRADVERLDQMLANLLGNALKFTPEGGHVELTASADGDSASISVRDTGAGIDAKLLPLVFERFQQGERLKTEKGRGLGLGLFICRHLAELHDGTISVDSDGPGCGTCFTIRLPLAGPAVA